MNRYKSFLQYLGPGLLYAGAAIGVSHVVQSTRAGANYGFYFVLAIILIHIIKYPFFEFAPRYASVKNKSLIEGYKEIGHWAFILFIVFTISTMFTILAAVTSVTAGIFGFVFHLEWKSIYLCAIILFITMTILLIGKFKWLDKIIKYIILLLAVSTIFAVFKAFQAESFQSIADKKFNLFKETDLLFLIAFVGWMPAPLDVSVWQSIWALAKQKEHQKMSLKSSLLDFKIGYIGTAVLAFCFLTLGALILYPKPDALSPGGVAFAKQFISMYAQSIGNWAAPIVIIAVLTTMFSTTITVMDAYPRILRKSWQLLFHTSKNNSTLYIIWMIILVAGTLLLLSILSGSMHFMVDLATTISFATAPLLAILNYIAVTNKHFPIQNRPKKAYQIFSLACIVLLCLFSIYYIFSYVMKFASPIH